MASFHSSSNDAVVPGMALKPTHLVATPIAHAKVAPPAAGSLLQC